jgi:hypothetical protein
LVRPTALSFNLTFSVTLFVNDGPLDNSVPPSCEYSTKCVALLWVEVGQPCLKYEGNKGVFCFLLSRYSDKVTGLVTEESWFDSRHGQYGFLFPKASSPVQVSCLKGTRCSFPGGKSEGSEVHLTSVSSTEVKNEDYTSTSPIPVAARSKAWVCGRSLTGIVGSKSA